MKLLRVRTVAVVLLIVFLTSTTFTGTAVAHTGDDGFHHHDGWMGTHGSWGELGFLWMVVWALVLLAIPAVLVYAYANWGNEGSGSGDEALATLRSRYARGEIDADEFETRRERLSRTDKAR